MNNKPKNQVSIVELLYVCNPEFNKDIKKIRDDFGIRVSDKKFNVYDCLDFDQKIRTLPSLGKKYLKSVELFSEKYQISDHTEELWMLIEGGIIKYSMSEECSMPDNILSITRPRIEEYTDGAEVTFRIRRKINKAELTRWVDEYSEQLITYSNDMIHGTQPSVVKVDNAERVLTILKLRNKKIGKTKRVRTFREIADLICEKYPQDDDVINGTVNEVSVRQICNRYQKRYGSDS